MLKKIAFYTFVFLLVSCSKKQINIGIQPYVGFESNLIDTIKIAIVSTYNAKVFVLPQMEVPKNSYVNIKTPRFRADSLIKDLKFHKPDTIDYVLGLINSDISTTKKNKNGKIKEPSSKYLDWGVFGLGYRPGPSCIVSTFRIKTDNYIIYLTRLKKVSIHEVGHNLGLQHCTSDMCVMQDAAETIKTVDMVNMELCEKCKRKIK
jgi:archaemetzincin